MYLEFPNDHRMNFDSDDDAIMYVADKEWLARSEIWEPYGPGLERQLFWASEIEPQLDETAIAWLVRPT